MFINVFENRKNHLKQIGPMFHGAPTSSRDHVILGGLLDNKENKRNIGLDQKCCAFD
jgi:hypothetical protein